MISRLRFVTGLLLLPTALEAAPRYLGPAKCISCHDHEKAKDWAAKDKHTKALAQLEDKVAAKYAAAIGLSDVYSLKGACVSCHATIFSGDANAGVSCETCHGPGSDYLEPHQKKGAHAQSVSLGMLDSRGSASVWATLCVDCHVMTDRKLIAAGHHSGANFEVSTESKRIVHWDAPYDYAKLTVAGKAAASKRLGAAPPPSPTQKPAAPAPRK
jgi:cytochrome c554/c'-like protein